MKYNFDKVTDRSKVPCVKCHPDCLCKTFNGNKDVFPMWVADMDLPSSEGVRARIQKVVDDGIFGYAYLDDSFFDAVKRWNLKTHEWDLKTEWIVFTAGVVAAINLIIHEFTKEGESVLIQPPVYYPFKRSILNNNRNLVLNPLIDTGNGYQIDFVDMEQKIIDNKVKLFIMCSPHNPVGRVWTKEELTKMGEICLKHSVLVVADEIHNDLILFNNKHTVFANISKEFAMNSITCTAPSKTFNLAGLHCSLIMIPNPEIREKYQSRLAKLGVGGANVVGMEATKGAYLESDEWYEEMLTYLEGNYKYLCEFVSEHIPQFKVYPLEGTYLTWIDTKSMNWTIKEAEEFFEVKAKLGIDHGCWFGDEGADFFRLNMACPRSLLTEGLNRIKNALEK